MRVTCWDVVRRPCGPDHVVVAVKRLAEAQRDGALLPEEVDAEMIAKVVSRWTGIPAARLLETDQGVEVHFERPARAVTPGQVCVLYEGDRVVAGGTIVRAL